MRIGANSSWLWRRCRCCGSVCCADMTENGVRREDCPVVGDR